MIWHLVAVVFAGLGAAGIALGLRALSGKRLPKWIIPVFAGLGMLGYQIYFEYNWFNFKQAQLPAGTVVVETEQGQVFWRPWTLRYPMTIAFSVVDTNDIEMRQAGEYRVAYYLEYRFEKQHVDHVSYQPYLLNCNTGDRVPVSGEGTTDLNRMTNLTEADPRFVTVCQ